MEDGETFCFLVVLSVGMMVINSVSTLARITEVRSSVSPIVSPADVVVIV